MEKRFTENGVTLVFRKNENSSKYSFLIEGDPELTEKLINSVKQKTVDAGSIHFAKQALFNKIREGNITRILTGEDNPMVQLNTLVQECWRGQNLSTRMVSKVGPDHSPVIVMEIKLPNGKLFEGHGSNQSVAKQAAAKQAIDYIDKEYYQ